jgi:hypothetical protein
VVILPADMSSSANSLVVRQGKVGGGWRNRNDGRQRQQARRPFSEEFDKGVNGRDARSTSGEHRGYRACIVN